MIKNIVFDFGNVLVEWNPQNIVSKVFPDANDSKLVEVIFRSPIWRELNTGKLTEQEVITHFHQTLAINLEQLQHLFLEIKHTQHPVPGSHELLAKLHQMDNYSLYGLTDNVHEIIAYLKERYTFFDYFKGVVTSANVGYLKPSPEIYQYLLTTYNLNPLETVFLDDIAANIEGAKLMGMHGIQFQNTLQCITELKKLNVII